MKWPGTLGARLAAVTAAAVLLSNIAVAVWLEVRHGHLAEGAREERMLDRVADAAAILPAVPPETREALARSLGSRFTRFEILHGEAPEWPMDAEERALALRMAALLPPEQADVRVRRRDVRPPPGSRREAPGPALLISIPYADGERLEAVLRLPAEQRLPLHLAITAAASILFVSAAAAFVARRATRPLSGLAAAATAAARGNEAPRVPEEGPDDVRSAAAAFNAMTDQVKRTLDNQRRLLSAVGHDLRTPLTAMRITAEFVGDPEIRTRLQKNLDELQVLTEAVLSAARGAAGEPMRSVDLAALIDSLCTDLAEMGEPVAWEPQDPTPYECRPNEIRRAVRNLIENAVRYGSHAHVRLEMAPERLEIVVEDDGPGIPPEDMARVFDPFVRLEDSRSSETGGAGLGLTLARAIAEGHGGDVVLENRDEGGLRARLRLPRSVVAG